MSALRRLAVDVMLAAMNAPNEPRKYPLAPNQESAVGRQEGSWPFQRGDGYENPSLERYTDMRFDSRPGRHRKWVVALAATLALLMLVVLGLMVAIYAEARGDEARPVDAIIVLGAAQYNGRPTDVLESRLQHSLDLYNRGLAPVIIVTGGKQEGDAFTEAETGEQWLMDRGVPQSAILMENQGRDTWANISGAREASRGRNIDSVLIVSDGFHLFRAERMANAVGFDAYTSPAPDSPIRPWSGVEFSYVIRETVAVIVQIPRWLF
jgi:uncharacterized SAM-binding protein YcdF (DUF218 family)